MAHSTWVKKCWPSPGCVDPVHWLGIAMLQAHTLSTRRGANHGRDHTWCPFTNNQFESDPDSQHTYIRLLTFPEVQRNHFRHQQQAPKQSQRSGSLAASPVRVGFRWPSYPVHTSPCTHACCSPVARSRSLPRKMHQLRTRLPLYVPHMLTGRTMQSLPSWYTLEFAAACSQHTLANHSSNHELLIFFAMAVATAGDVADSTKAVQPKRGLP